MYDVCREGLFSLRHLMKKNNNAASQWVSYKLRFKTISLTPILYGTYVSIKVRPTLYPNALKSISITNNISKLNDEGSKFKPTFSYKDCSSWKDIEMAP
jgi:hypothetical protein